MKKLLPFLLLLFGLNSTKASHIAGCDMTYSYIGNQKYVIYIDLYRDCRGTALANSVFTYYYRFQNSSGAGQQYTPTKKPTLINISEVSNYCRYAIPFCTKENTQGQGFGLERHRYTDTVDLTNSTIKGHIAAGRCIFVPFILVDQARPNQGSSQTQSMFNAEISLCNLSSPKMAFNHSGEYASKPMNKLQCNVGNYMSYGVNDPDQDSISYNWVKARTSGYGQYMNYTSPISEKYPITCYCSPPSANNIKCTPKPEDFIPKGIYLNEWTGDVVLTPYDCSGFYTVVVEARQYRKDSLGTYQYMGCTRRDLSVWTTDLTSSGSNKSAYNLAPFVNKEKDHIVCAKRNLSFDFSIKDSTWNGYQNAPDTLEIEWTGLPKGATISETKKAVNHYEYQFNWNTTIEDARDHVYPIRVKAIDNHCSPPMVTYRTFSIFVDGGCCDSFTLDSIIQSGNGFYKVGDSLSISTDTINGFSDVNYQWQGSSKNIDFGNIRRASPYDGVNSVKLNVDSVQFYHEEMNFRLLAFTDICADTSNKVTLQLADTCFLVHIDTVIVNDSVFHHFFDTTVVTKWDTGYIQVYDTITTERYDTIYVKVNYNDTSFVSIYDTTFITVEDTLHFSIPLSGSSPLINTNIEIYPNPTSDKLLIKIGNYLDFLNYRIEVRDMGGKLLESTTVNNPIITFNILKWNVSSGMYYLRIKDSNNKIIAVKKIVIDVR